MVWSSFRTGFIAFTAVLATATLALPQKASAFDDAEKAEIGQIIHDYLLANPEVMVEVQNALEQQREAKRVAAQRETLKDNHDEIYSTKDQIEIGNPDAKVTVVEFFDYNCGFCHRALSDMNRLVKENDNLRFILREFPILSPQSLEAHKISIAFSNMMPDKAAEFHRALLGADGRKDGEMALDLGVSLGADREKLKAASEAPEVMAAIRESHKLADGLGITGTPSYVIGDEVVFGAVGFDNLADRIAQLGSCGKVNC
ncbi:MAG: DsbA family protein [Salaquimonas sp.]|nr:DsbA family protein [Salaquimonas sp.]